MRFLLISWEVLQTVRCTAALARVLAVAVAVFCLLEPLLWFIGFPVASIVVGTASDAMHLSLLSLLAVLCPWGHEVLLARRGFELTRALTPLVAALGLALLVCTVYTCVAQDLLIRKQGELHLLLSLLLPCIVLLNLHNMAAAPKWLRASLAWGASLFLPCALLGGEVSLLLPYTVLKLACALLFVRPLALLQRNVLRIASLPEAEEGGK